MCSSRSLCFLTNTSAPIFTNYRDATWASWRLKSPAFPLFVHPFVQAHIKENLEALVTVFLWGESTGDRLIPLKKGQQCGIFFYLMTSSWRTVPSREILKPLIQILEGSSAPVKLHIDAIISTHNLAVWGLNITRYYASTCYCLMYIDACISFK